MTVSTEVDHNEYTGNGVTTTFPYTFRIFHKSDLVVQVVDLDENITVLALDTDYTVTGAGGYSGGNVILTTALANGNQISISRELPVTQETDLRNQGKFFAEVHEDAFDKLTMLIQQVRSWFSLALRKPSFVANYYDALGNYIRNLRDPSRPQDAATKKYVDQVDNINLRRTLRVPESYVNSLPAVENRRNKLLGFDAAGNPLPVLPMDGSASDVMIELANNGDKKIGSSYGGNVYTDYCPSQFKKLYEFGDLGSVFTSRDAVFNKVDGFWYIYKPNSFPVAIPAAPDSNWINIGLLNGFPVNSVLNYGADNSGIVDSTDAFDLCFIAAAARWSSPRWGWEIGGSVVDVPAGFYKLTRPILLQRGVWVKGAGISRTVIYADTVEPTADGAAVFYVKRYTGSGDTTYENNNITVDGLDIYCSSDIDGINLDTAPFKSRVVNCGVRNAKNGISIYKSHTADVTDCLIDTCAGWGIYGYANHNSVISKNRIHRCKTCVRVEGAPGILVIRENVFQWSNEHAIRVTDVASVLAIENNYFEWCCRSLEPAFWDSVAYIFVDATYNSSVNQPVTNIRGNSIQISFNPDDGYTENVGNGIRVTHGKCVNIEENYIGYTSSREFGPKRGIYLGPSIERAVLAGNYINSGNVAILSERAAARVVEYGNTIISGSRSYAGPYVNFDDCISNNSGGFQLNLTTSIPATPKVGSSYFSISAGKPLYWNGTNWRDSMGNIAN